MSAGLRKTLTLVASVVALLFVAWIAIGSVGIFMTFRGNPKLAGAWEDDPKNWYRAFHEQPPAGVVVIHSKYWRSDHFTYEYIYYFEVEAAPTLRASLLKQRNVEVVPQTNAWSFRMGTRSDDTPAWFAPDPVDRYEVWDKPGYHGSIWIDKTNGHMHFYEIHL